ncbi:MAG TPA: CPBP family intramembrane glutamic endopeptidase [Candidatus Babeliales bacterium]|jgi:hypothetical protein|nr:CPBP family intramembrane glutamic endopeptidase [Candidatus Babeliales bacterium]
MEISLRSPFVWISATILSGLMYFFAFHFFPQTFPIIHISITMDLEHALQKAHELDQKYHFTPHDYQSAAMFNTDNNVKTFVELEAGGKDAFIAMMDEKLYMPYTWQVRHFKEHEKNETTIIFTPDGKPYGFVETLSENIPGAQLSESDAQKIAEHDATKDWSIDFSQYTLVEASQKLETSGRLDHTFIYERKDKKIGPSSPRLCRTAPAENLSTNDEAETKTCAGLYRLKIVVSGDKMTRLNHFVKVPEAFNRRYAEMRSANNIIAWVATILMVLLYILVGCGFGLLYLTRHRWQIIRQPLLWGTFLSALSTLVTINQLPFLWMRYQTSLSSYGFFIQLLLSLLIQFFLYTAFLTTVITVAEGLTRRAFGNHPQLWSLFKSDVVTSYAVFGRIFGGYLLVGLSCAFVIAFYYFSTNYLGWWSPAEMLFDPNILATYAPWFSPIAQSLNAGFMEECLFRAIPLAGAALIGNYFGKRNWWIGAAFIVQAIIFGAAHANYPVQPAYARLIELLIPSFIWGAIYLRFGLLSTIIAHFVYDVVWFSIPIFVSQLPHVYAYKLIIIFITCLPIFYALYARLRKNSWTTLSTLALNASWNPKEIIHEKSEPIVLTTESYNLTANIQKLIVGLGIAGLITWIYVTPFTHDGVSITLTRNEAIEASNKFLEEKKNFVPSDKQWKTLPLIFPHYKTVPQIALQHKFIWQEGKKELYHRLLGTYLRPAHWTIRYAQFDSDIIQRTEEYKVMLLQNKVWQCYHQLSETIAGAHLTQSEARVIALSALQEQFNLTPQEVSEISATSSQLPHRKDWTFIFADPKASPLQTGQARISVKIAGDEVVDNVRFIHVPEEWERAAQHKQNMLNIFITVFAIIFVLLLLVALYMLSKQHKQFIFSKYLFFILFGVNAIILCIDAINAWPSIIGIFNTSVPFSTQLFQSITGLIISSVLKAAAYAAIISSTMTYKRAHCLSHNWITITLGICSGLFLAGSYAIIQLLIPTDMPLWPEYISLSYTIPAIADITNALVQYVKLTTIFSFLFMLIDTTTKQWTQHRTFFTVFLALCGMMMFQPSSIDAIGIWIFAGVLFGGILCMFYRYLIRYDYALIPLTTGSFTTLSLLQQGIFNAYPEALIYACVSICLVSGISVMWYWCIQERPLTFK